MTELFIAFQTDIFWFTALTEHCLLALFPSWNYPFLFIQNNWPDWELERSNDERPLCGKTSTLDRGVLMQFPKIITPIKPTRLRIPDHGDYPISILFINIICSNLFTYYIYICFYLFRIFFHPKEDPYFYKKSVHKVLSYADIYGCRSHGRCMWTIWIMSYDLHALNMCHSHIFFGKFWLDIRYIQNEQFFTIGTNKTSWLMMKKHVNQMIFYIPPIRMYMRLV